MKKDKNFFPWCFPCNFFMFLGFFLTVKFIFIFIFNGFYEPDFIFDLTPFFLLSGFSKMQLLFLSYVVVIFDLFLHLNPTHKNIRISFLPTVLLISGTGVALTTSNLGLEIVPYLIIFLCLLMIMVIDNRFILEFEDLEEAPTKIPVKEIVKKPVYITPRTSRFHPIKSLFASFKELDMKKRFKDHIPKLPKAKPKPKPIEYKVVDKEPRPSVSHGLEEWAEADLDVTYDEDIMDISGIIDKKLENLDDKLNELEEKQEKMKPLEKDEGKSIEKTVQKSEEKTVKADVKPQSKQLKKQESKNMLEEINDSAAIVKQGIFKQINDPLKDLLGYDKEEILDKNLIDFISYEGLSGLEDYYFNKLDHEPVLSFNTVFKTKDNKKLAVEVKIKSVFVEGEKMDIAIFKKIKSV